MNEDVTMLNLLALSENTYIKTLFCIFRTCMCVYVSYHWAGQVIPQRVDHRNWARSLEELQMLCKFE